MLSKIKPSVSQRLETIILHAPYISPNLITLAGVIFPFLFLWTLVSHSYILALITLVASATDALDGAMARARKKTSEFGGFLDSTIDRISDFLIITAFGFAGIIRFEIVLPFLLVSFLTSYSRAKIESLRSGKCTVGIMERTERLIGIFIALLMYRFFDFSIYELNSAEWIFIILSILTAYTVLQRVLFARIHLS